MNKKQMIVADIFYILGNCRVYIRCRNRLAQFELI